MTTLKKIITWDKVLILAMLVLCFLYKNGMLTYLIYDKSMVQYSWMQTITAQFMHFSFIHYLCNAGFGLLILDKLRKYYSEKKIVLCGIGSMSLVSVALLIFAKEGLAYAGFSGIVLGWYGLWYLKSLELEKNIHKKREMIIEGIVFIVLTTFSPGVSIVMHMAGLLVGVSSFYILKNVNQKHL